MSIIEDRLQEILQRNLDDGSHRDFEHGMCVMEAVSYVAGEPWSDHPQCASRVITDLLIGLNDRWSDQDRQLLKPYIVRVVGTNTGAEDDDTRRFMIRDWLVHEYAPAMFRASGATAEAEQFERLVRITDAGSWQEVRSTIYAVRDAAWERRSAASASAVADAAAAASASADAVAAAVADAAAAASAVAVADAAAAASASADAVAAAVADAAAAASAVAVADAVAFKQVVAEAAKAAEATKGGYWDRREAAYRVFRPYYDNVWRERFVGLGLRESVLQLVDRLIEVGTAGLTSEPTA